MNDKPAPLPTLDPDSHAAQWRGLAPQLSTIRGRLHLTVSTLIGGIRTATEHDYEIKSIDAGRADEFLKSIAEVCDDFEDDIPFPF